MKRLEEVRRIGRHGGVKGAWGPDLDGRAPILATAIYIFAVVSVGKYALGQALAFAVLPLAAIPVLGIPAREVLRKLLFVSPFVCAVGAFNPFLDTRPLLEVGPVTLSAGWVSFLVIVCKAFLTVAAVTLLAGLLPFEGIAAGLRRLKAPEALVTQLLFLHRYLFLLVEEAQSMRKARDLKSFGRRGLGLSVTAGLLGSLFIRTLDRSQRIHRAMLSRGYDGTLRLAPGRGFGLRDGLCVLAAAALCVAIRLGVP